MDLTIHRAAPGQGQFVGLAERTFNRGRAKLLDRRLLQLNRGCGGTPPLGSVASGAVHTVAVRSFSPRQALKRRMTKAKPPLLAQRMLPP
jgi:hypothetical protein